MQHATNARTDETPPNVAGTLTARGAQQVYDKAVERDENPCWQLPRIAHYQKREYAGVNKVDIPVLSCKDQTPAFRLQVLENLPLPA